MILAKLYNILEHMMSSGVPLDTQIQVGLYSMQNDQASLSVCDINGVVADASSGVVYLACGDRVAPFKIHHTGEKPHEWDTFVLKVDGSEGISNLKSIEMSVDQ